MQKIAIFGDIHGNLNALESVWEKMDELDIDQRFCLGDLVGYGVQPNEVINFIQQHNVPTIMGNYDQGVGYDSDDCGCAYTTPEAQALGEQSIAWSNAHVTNANKTYLRNLPMTMSLMLGKKRVLLVHGSPRRINEYLYEDRPESGIQRLFDMTGADIMICGHTHKPYDRTLASGKRLINAGSVGKPKDGNNEAGFLLLTAKPTGDGEPYNATISAKMIRVPYDVEATATMIEATEMPNAFAHMLRDGKG